MWAHTLAPGPSVVRGGPGPSNDRREKAWSYEQKPNQHLKLAPTTNENAILEASCEDLTQIQEGAARASHTVPSWARVPRVLQACPIRGVCSPVVSNGTQLSPRFIHLILCETHNISLLQISGCVSGLHSISWQWLLFCHLQANRAILRLHGTPTLEKDCAVWQKAFRVLLNAVIFPTATILLHSACPLAEWFGCLLRAVRIGKGTIIISAS